MIAILAALPLLILILLLAGFGWNTLRAGVAAWVAAVLVAVPAFGLNLEVLLISQGKALFLAVDILLIIWGALLFHQVCDEAGVIAAFGSSLAAWIRDRRSRALLIAWAFASFLQGAGGFGVPVVVTAPLLIGAGFSPLAAVVLPSIGHGWAVTFGSMGISFQALQSVSGLPADSLASPTALLLAIACIASGLLVAKLASDERGFQRAIPLVLMAGIGMGAVQWLLAVSGLWMMAALGAGLAGIGIILFWCWRFGEIDRRAIVSGPRFRDGIAAYSILFFIVLMGQAVAPVREILRLFTLRVWFPEAVTGIGFFSPAEFSRSINVFGHAGFLLAAAALLVYLWLQLRHAYARGSAVRILKATLQSAAQISGCVVVIVGMASMFAHAGMTASIAEGLAGWIGSAYPVLAPFLGAIGAFSTGSNVHSNILFAPLQQRMAQALALDERVILAAQTAGGAVGSVLSPAKIAVGVRLAQQPPAEGEVLRRLLLPVGILCAVLAGAVILLFAL